MSRQQSKVNTHAISTLIIALIIVIIVGSVVAVVIAAALLGFWPFGLVGSGILVTEKKDFSDFTIVEVGWGFEVEIGQADSYSINITADDNMFDYIEVSHTGDTLTIGLKWGYGYQNVTLRAKITMPGLYGLEFSGGTHGAIEGFSTSHEIVLDLSGGSRLTGGFNTSLDAQFTLSGGSRLSLDGIANNLLISASGGSHLELSAFAVHNSSVNLSGGSDATINLDGRLDADLSGGSHLLYIGDPIMGIINMSGGSTVSEKP